MKLSYNDLLLQILSILNYADKEAFVENFEKTNHLESMMNCIERLPSFAQEDIKEHASDQQIIQKYISKEEYTQELTTVSTKALSGLLQHVTPALTDDQKEKIASLF